MDYDLENDLMDSTYIRTKCMDDSYAQNLYAALCNNDFIKNEIIPILREETWHCSWRYAGALVAQIRDEGDYLTWYCSGIGGLTDYNHEEGEQYMKEKGYVMEGVVTEEIRNDLLHINWLVCVDND
jgi:hypothetical protein